MQNLFGKQEGAKNIGNHLSIIIYHHNAPMDFLYMITPTQSCLVLFYCAIFKKRNVDIIVFGENYTFSDEVDFIDDKVDMRKIPKY